MSDGPYPLSFRRLSPSDGRTIDAVLVDPHSSGMMQLPGVYTSESPPPAYGWKIGPRGDAGVRAAAVHVGSFHEYVVRVEIENSRDTPSTVSLFWITTNADES